MNDATNAKDIVGKLRVSLVPTALIRAVAEVRAYGTAKYGNPENWIQVDKTYYVDALLRHVLNYIDDPAGVDSESGLPHMAHAACNAAFILAMDGGAKREKSAHETHAPVCDASDAEPVPDGEVPAEPEPQPAEQIRCDARRYIFGLFHIICPNCGKVSDFGVKKTHPLHMFTCRGCGESFSFGDEMELVRADLYCGKCGDAYWVHTNAAGNCVDVSYKTCGAEIDAFYNAKKRMYQMENKT